MAGRHAEAKIKNPARAFQGSTVLAACTAAALNRFIFAANSSTVVNTSASDFSSSGSDTPTVTPTAAGGYDVSLSNNSYTASTLTLNGAADATAGVSGNMLTIAGPRTIPLTGSNTFSGAVSIQSRGLALAGSSRNNNLASANRINLSLNFSSETDSGASISNVQVADIGVVPEPAALSVPAMGGIDGLPRRRGARRRDRSSRE